MLSIVVHFFIIYLLLCFAEGIICAKTNKKIAWFIIPFFLLIVFIKQEVLFMVLTNARGRSIVEIVFYYFVQFLPVLVVLLIIPVTRRIKKYINSQKLNQKND